MTVAVPPDVDEVALGAFLEDIGKFMQRAHPGNGALPESVLRRASDVLPAFDGRSSHWHALWTDAFFDDLERAGVALPGGLNLARVRDAAVYHHNPLTPLHWLSAEADRLSAGLDRKPKDEAAERADAGGPGGFRRVPLRSIFSDVRLHDKDPPPRRSYPVAALEPGALVPQAEAGTAGYATLWPRFRDECIDAIRRAPNVALLHESLLSVSERYTWAIPSSTIDQPDVSLHDHNRSVAAIAACLYLHHRARGELDSEAAIRDRDRAKFRFLAGDLSGIQRTLFRLAAQQVKGVARILRARSFLMAHAVEAASLLCRRRLGLPPHCELQNAGGRFLLLVPEVDGLEATVEAVRGELDRWAVERTCGDLAVNIALGPAVCGRDLLHDRLAGTMAAVDRAVAAAKLHPLARHGTGVLAEPPGAEGQCAACGVRPATRADGGVRRCVACDDDHRAGRLLPRARVVLWGERDLPEAVAPVRVAMPGGLVLGLADAEPRDDDRDAWGRVVSGYRLGEARAPLARRFLANHVPLLDAGRHDPHLFGELGAEARETGAGEPLTFEHLAALAREVLDAGGDRTRIVGRPLLAVLKADVDRLGQIFSRGLGGDRSLGRMAALSRLMDSFFTLVLPDLLRREVPDTYTVYAGGDDLLLLGPWRQMLDLAPRIEAAFRAHVGGNAHVTISAGIELCHAAEPLNRVAHRAEQRLEAAKHAGRNRVSVIDDTPLTWDGLRTALALAQETTVMLRDPAVGVSTAFAYRALHFARERERADGGDVRAADWRARWAYHLRRAFGRDDERIGFFDRLLSSGLTAAPDSGVRATLPLTVAINRNR